MALNITSQETDRLARELAAVTGESITEAVTRALEERLSRCRAPGAGARRAALREIQARVAALPERDPRTDDEVLGYDELGRGAGPGRPLSR